MFVRAFFKMWWDKATTEDKAKAKAVIENGQLSFVVGMQEINRPMFDCFVLGGWVMPDEATPTYSAMIDQVLLFLFAHLRWYSHSLLSLLRDTFSLIETLMYRPLLLAGRYTLF